MYRKRVGNPGFKIFNTYIAMMAFQGWDIGTLCGELMKFGEVSGVDFSTLQLWAPADKRDLHKSKFGTSMLPKPNPNC